VGLALVAAWSLPWSIMYQATLAAMAATAIIANAAVMDRVAGGDVLVPLLLTAGSVPMALLGSRRRAALTAARSEAR
ncbi:hypothetical protein NL529_34855, partial [Klebsiella pneumoniae]|nr:hypothetical protein [Klebsiella pneumoniae]